MTDTSERPGDQEPEPLKHSDAQRLSSDDTENADAEEIENDPSRNPEESELRDIKGG